ncbi:competence protein ComEC [Mycoplasmopsis agassizii]|nr:competence protein ComEC [Mycoplasmopsis agassizii]
MILKIIIDNVEKNLNSEFKVVRKFKNSYILQKGIYKYFLKSNLDLEEYDILKISGNLQLINIDDYNFSNFLKSENVFYEIKNFELNKISDSFSFKSELKKYFANGSDIYQKYMSLFYLGKVNNLNEFEYQQFQNLQLLHLVIISGFHLSIVKFVYFKIFKLFKMKQKYIDLSFIFIVIFLLIFFEFHISIFRYATVYLLSIIFRYLFSKKINHYFLILISLNLFLILNPFYLIRDALIFSYGLSFYISFLNKLNYKNKIIKFLIMSITTYFMAVPLIVLITNKFIIFAYFFTLLATPIIGVIYIFSAIFFYLKDFLSFIFEMFDWLINRFIEINFYIEISNVYKWFYLPYYIIFSLSTILIIKNIKPKIKHAKLA